MRLTEFTKAECDKLREECNFTPDERAVFDLRSSARSIVEISMTMNISESTVNRRIHAIKKKILKVL